MCTHSEVITTYLYESGLKQSELARYCKISKGAVSHWVTGRRNVSPHQAMNLQRSTFGKIRAAQFHPDLF